MVNAVILLLGVLAWFLGGYFIYGRFIEKKLVKPTNEKTPAHIFRNNIDYKSTKKVFLFGHHFASIAGAGPIIGPILAVSYFGWFFVVLWIALGSVFIGAIHDYLSLIISVRHKGEGIAKISEKVTGKRSFYVFTSLLWLTLMLIITVFSVSSAESLVKVPELVIPFFGITLTAFLLGLAIYKFKAGRVISSLIAIIFVIFSIWIGINFPVSLPFSEHFSLIFWIFVLFIYAFIVSLIPVWLVLQPRDYLSSISLFLFLGVGLIAVMIARPEMNAPAVLTSNLPLWPILFITVACGAVSGFHALVSSGTTSKQLDKEKDGKFIAYGGMLAEGLVAVLILIFVGAGLKWGAPVLGDMNFFQNALSESWIIAFGRGFANIVNSAFPFLGISLLMILGALIIITFILTSLDTSTRIGRMLASEAFPKRAWINNKVILTLLILIPAFILAVTNSYATLWRMFGASNQLIASVVLIAISSYLVEHKKPILYTLIPSFFMIATTLGALFYGLFSKTGYIFGELNLPLVVISSILIIFAILIFIEVLVRIFKKEYNQKAHK